MRLTCWSIMVVYLSFRCCLQCKWIKPERYGAKATRGGATIPISATVLPVKYESYWKNVAYTFCKIIHYTFIYQRTEFSKLTPVTNDIKPQQNSVPFSNYKDLCHRERINLKSDCHIFSQNQLLLSWYRIISCICNKCLPYQTCFMPWSSYHLPKLWCAC